MTTATELERGTYGRSSGSVLGPAHELNENRNMEGRKKEVKTESMVFGSGKSTSSDNPKLSPLRGPDTSLQRLLHYARQTRQDIPPAPHSDRHLTNERRLRVRHFDQADTYFHRFSR